MIRFNRVTLPRLKAVAVEGSASFHSPIVPMQRTTENNLLAKTRPFWMVLKNHIWFLVIPTVICAGLACLYGLTKTDIYTARQSLVIRDDLVGDSFKPGRFESLESLKSAQNTVLEIVRRPEVIGAALEKLGPPKPGMFGGASPDMYPDEETIEAVQGLVSLSAPNGAEFGKTEVFVLLAKSPSRERARKFVELLLVELDAKLHEVRSDKLKSMQTELRQKLRAAEQGYDEASNALNDLEKELGPDVTAIRSMSANEPTEGSIQKKIQELEAEERAAMDQLETARKQVQLLEFALKHPENVPSTSSELFALQPTLEPLFVGLSTAQLDKATLSGRYQPSHPDVRNAEETIRGVVSRIKEEVKNSIQGLAFQIEGLQGLIDRRQAAKQQSFEKLNELGDLRTEYDRLNVAVENAQKLMAKANEDLVEILSLGTPDEHAAMLNQVGAPQVATAPDGIGKKSLVLAASMAGFMMGIGLVMLIVPFGDGNSNGETANLESSTSPEIDPPVRTQWQQPAPKERSGREDDAPKRPREFSPASVGAISTPIVPAGGAPLRLKARDNSLQQESLTRQQPIEKSPPAPSLDPINVPNTALRQLLNDPQLPGANPHAPAKPAKANDPVESFFDTSSDHPPTSPTNPDSVTGQSSAAETARAAEKIRPFSAFERSKAETVKVDDHLSGTGERAEIHLPNDEPSKKQRERKIQPGRRRRIQRPIDVVKDAEKSAHDPPLPKPSVEPFFDVSKFDERPLDDSTTPGFVPPFLPEIPLQSDWRDPAVTETEAAKLENRRGQPAVQPPSDVTVPEESGESLDPIPDQIRALADSLSSFITPLPKTKNEQSTGKHNPDRSPGESSDQ